MTTINFESPSVQSYLTILQGVISRMASNSSACKAWCVALVSAVIVIIADKGKPDYVGITIIPLVLFFFLDSYYLALERMFRAMYNSFIEKLHAGSAKIDDVFIVTPDSSIGQIVSETFRSARSISVWPFYGLLAAMLAIVRLWII